MRVSIQPLPDGKLIIDPIIQSKPVKVKTINISEVIGAPLERDIIAAYIAGYDKIELVGKRIKSEQKNIIRQLCYKLIGPEIIEESSSKVILQDLLGPNDLPIKKGIYRMFLISNSMYKDSLKAFKKGDHDLAKDVKQRDDEVDRLYLLISKQFRSITCGTGIPDTSESTIEEYHDFRMAANPLERIADHAQQIAKTVENINFEHSKETIDLVDNAGKISQQIIADSIESLFNSNTALANQVFNKNDELRYYLNELGQVAMKLESYELIAPIQIIANSIQRVGEYGTNIAEMAINSAINQK